MGIRMDRPASYSFHHALRLLVAEKEHSGPELYPSIFVTSMKMRQTAFLLVNTEQSHIFNILIRCPEQKTNGGIASPDARTNAAGHQTFSKLGLAPSTHTLKPLRYTVEVW
ncbi:hypothetical protein TGGT1_289745 [Toxoplasma gondii GT1]|uniref:Uncharacterized protein n=8 Tax=Toxoplasma gondii TaxID=5811 RepID=A0A125YZG1_TOXGV|nr:hypothetical protein TGGT1_289745 [Toxoplasma gondii GT1]ESS33689.1 hypothetical protein TGVEG_289745 [Toxoplasma gondii VEG]KAF4644456.1 hypothetical protein TGRH88_014500 [Toxoplasma gondii]KFG33301.1 hypothetical protein TGP89_289745 [Toxoplasma gondii p89]KFG53347.1 hypothetical protein TGFOU_289745 [Toxoplasma gondii FOU]RQX73750.1 hypothetical protein TGCAST_289745 [Toxoplasma gondii CAST]